MYIHMHPHCIGQLQWQIHLKWVHSLCFTPKKVRSIDITIQLYLLQFTCCNVIMHSCNYIHGYKFKVANDYTNECITELCYL